MINQTSLLCMTAAIFFVSVNFSYGQQPSNQDLMPPVTEQSQPATAQLDALNAETHPTLKLNPDKSELIQLDREASSVVIGNSAHIGVMLDTPTLAVVIPRAEGATYFAVLDKDGKVIMQRHVIVGTPKERYVRIRRSCGNVAEGAACRPTSVYFCPDMCHEIGTGGESTTAASSGGEAAVATE